MDENSSLSQGVELPTRQGTLLTKKTSIKRSGSLRRSGSRRSSRAGSVRSLVLQPSGDIEEELSAFCSPVPTSGSPTDVLANRFQAWRKVLKDLITYFREVQAGYDQRAKAFLKISNVINNTTTSKDFLESGGISDGLEILRAYHKNATAEANKSKDIENEVILALTELRSDLQLKIKEIKSLSGDFKNSVEKEMDVTRKLVSNFHDSLGHSDHDPMTVTGKQDPYLLKLAVDRQIEKQIDEENYLHQAYQNIQASGRELESIVVSEIQKSYSAYAAILKREGDAAYSVVEELRSGPIEMPKDHEWNAFVQSDEHFVDPSIEIRKAERIRYPGRDNELAQEVRAGLLERKSKYLKSYTPGWYVLSPTHLHEFKSADKSQVPVMSLCLLDQKLGSHSTESGTSNKFLLKGRQTGSMHRGHSWVFRAESYETMLAWFEAIKILTETSPQERNAFVRQHVRSVSGTSKPASISSDGMVDEEDEEPFSAAASAIVTQGLKQDVLSKRPRPGGRFPSTDLIVNSGRGLQAPLSPSSGSSGVGAVEDRDVAATSAHPGSGVGQHYAEDPATSPTHAAMVNHFVKQDGINPYTNEPIQNYNKSLTSSEQPSEAVAAVGLGGIALGAAGAGMRRNVSPITSADLERQAAAESAQIAAPDLDNAHSGTSNAISTTQNLIPDAVLGTNSQPAISKDNAQDQPVHETLADESSNPIREILEPLTHDPRPTLAAGQNHLSVQSVSQLHVPGEFPKQGTS